MVKPFHSEARRKLLHYFYTHEEAKHYLREIATMLEIDPGNLSRELRRLETEGLFQSKKRGNQKCFFLNPAYLHYSELRQLFTTIPDNPEGIDPAF
jgi:predicted transcriptional regulator